MHTAQHGAATSALDNGGVSSTPLMNSAGCSENFLRPSPPTTDDATPSLLSPATEAGQEKDQSSEAAALETTKPLIEEGLTRFATVVQHPP